MISIGLNHYSAHYTDIDEISQNSGVPLLSFVESMTFVKFFFQN